MDYRASSIKRSPSGIKEAAKHRSHAVRASPDAYDVWWWPGPLPAARTMTPCRSLTHAWTLPIRTRRDSLIGTTTSATPIRTAQLFYSHQSPSFTRAPVQAQPRWHPSGQPHEPCMAHTTPTPRRAGSAPRGLARSSRPMRRPRGIGVQGTIRRRRGGCRSPFQLLLKGGGWEWGKGKGEKR